ncbi:MAG: NADP oxidoreductase [Rhodothalassiaceae bacterium]|nr:MAG: NADP oxidoreductase [Rhodothalassiaceae bacterium]
MSNEQPLTVAIVGAGPAGYYTAERLLASGRPVEIAMIDRLPTPYGLIRFGVAPDHQSIKAVYRRYEKTAMRPEVSFFGNVEVGRDVTLDELLELFDAVVISCGAGADRPFEVPGADLKGVIGSAAFVGWYNCHPDFCDLDVDLDIEAAAVIGHGNVAVDVVRILAKTEEELAASDINPEAALRIARSPLRDLYMIGRRGPHEAKFTPKELGELGELKRAVPLVDPAQLPPEDSDAALDPGHRKVMEILRAYAANRPGDKPVRIHILFYARPVAVLGERRVEGLRLERTRVEADGRAVGTGEMFDIPCGLVVPCIGYRSTPIAGLPYDPRRGCFVNEDGRIRERIYAAGWARRGPTGTIGTNKPDGAEIADRLLAEVEPGGRPGRAGLRRLLAARHKPVVRFRDWKRIEAEEERRGGGIRPRVKIARRDELLAIAGAHPPEEEDDGTRDLRSSAAE